MRTMTLILAAFLTEVAPGYTEASSVAEPTAVVSGQAVDPMAKSAETGSELGESADDRQDQTDEPAARSKNGKAKAAIEVPASEAEQIARLSKTIDEDQARLAAFRHELEDPDSEYARAEKAFKELDSRLTDQQARVEDLTEQGDKDELETAQRELTDLETRWQLAKERFELAIKERRILQEKVATLEEKIKQDQAALDRLKGAVQPIRPVATPEPASVPVAAPAAPVEGPAATPTTPLMPAGVSQANGKSAEPAPAAPVTKPDPPPAVTEARKDAEQKQNQAKQAQEQVQSISQRIEMLERDTEADRQLLTTARQKVTNAIEARRTLEAELADKRKQGAPAALIDDLTQKRDDATQRLEDARNAASEIADRLNKRQTELVALQSEEIQALREAEQKESEAQAAQKKVTRLENPFAPHNVAGWLFTHGPKLLIIVLCVLLLLWLANMLDRKLVAWVTGNRAGTLADQNRAKTLVSVLHNALSVLIVVAGTMMILDEVGVNVGVVMGGAAIIGLAVAFGAQNLVRDYFYGFVILLENQYAIGDIVRIADLSGQVERITLRITVLRGLDGTVHFLPNGEITKVSNMTHGWSRALFDVGVAYGEDIDHVIEVLVELGRELRADPSYAPLILDDLEMLGVEALGDSAVVVRFYLKTRPLAQFTVRREMLRRIKNRFDELKIEIPFPHRTVYHRHTNGTSHEPLDFAAAGDFHHDRD